jgi:outer membrane protein assembly factor BamB
VGWCDGQLIALDKAKGRVLWTFGKKDEDEKISGDPIICGDVVLACLGKRETFLVALDLARGKELWRISRLPDKGQPAGTPGVHEGMVLVKSTADYSLCAFK